MRPSVLVSLLLLGAWTVPGLAQAVPNPGGLTPTWRYSGPADWRAQAVSLGNRTTQVFCHGNDADTAAVLVSRHETNFGAAPVWVDPTEPARGKSSDSARDVDVHASITAEYVASNQHIIRVHKYSSQGLDWTYTHPDLTTGFFHVRVSWDGQAIVAVIPNGVTGVTDVLVFGPGSSVPVAVWTLPGSVTSFEMSADAGRAVARSGSSIHVLDIGLGTSTIEMSSSFLRAVAMSADGSVFAVAEGPGRIHVYQWNGSEYDLYMTRTWSGGGIPSAIAISDDNTTVAYGYSLPHPGTDAHVECLDLPSMTVAMEETLESFGLFSNRTSAVAITQDGSRFAVALMGDQPQLWDRVRLYDKWQAEPIASYDLETSATDIDISPDGKWLAVAGVHDHLDHDPHSGRLYLFQLEPVDVDIQTTPSVGSTITIDVNGNPLNLAYLVVSPFVAEPPLSIPGVGDLRVDLATLSLIHIGSTDANGDIAITPTLPPDPSFVGLSLYLQGLTTPPNRLTEDYLTLTFLP